MIIDYSYCQHGISWPWNCELDWVVHSTCRVVQFFPPSFHCPYCWQPVFFSQETDQPTGEELEILCTPVPQGKFMVSTELSYCKVHWLLLFSCPVCNPMDCSTPGFPVLHYLQEFAQTHVHRVGAAIQPSHPLSHPLESLAAPLPDFHCTWTIPSIYIVALLVQVSVFLLELGIPGG